MAEATEAPKSTLNPTKLSRKAVCTGLFDVFGKGLEQGTAAGLAVARAALMDAAKLHGLTEKKADGQLQTWETFLDRIWRDHLSNGGGASAEG